MCILLLSGVGFMHSCISVEAHTSTHIYTHLYTHMYIHIHKYTHTHTPACMHACNNMHTTADSCVPSAPFACHTDVQPSAVFSHAGSQTHASERLPVGGVATAAAAVQVCVCVCVCGGGGGMSKFVCVYVNMISCLHARLLKVR